MKLDYCVITIGNTRDTETNNYIMEEYHEKVPKSSARIISLDFPNPPPSPQRIL
jgi:hypothetical protein